jgi:hypothetical protein
MRKRTQDRQRSRCLRLESLESRQLLDGSGLLISEFMADNDATLDDFAGDTPDWIEIHNPTADPVDLADWYLTDSSDDLTRWQFPAAAVSVVDPGEYLVVFASGKAGSPDVPAAQLHTNFKLSAAGEYLGLVMPDGVTVVSDYGPTYPEQLSDISYGTGGTMAIAETLVDAGAGARVLVPSGGSLGSSWTGGNEPFDDSTWIVGATGVGYDTRSDYDGRIETDVEAAMHNGNTSAYVRIPLDVAQPDIFTSLSLEIDYDDGFVAHLNGVEIAARNAPATPAFDSSSTTNHEANGAESIDVTAYRNELVAGTNVLAIQGLNWSPTSSDFLILPRLVTTRAVIGPDDTFYYATPTPGGANVPGALGKVKDTSFSVDRGFFDAAFQVEITTATPDAEIRYTLDGSPPTATTGSVYTGPIDITTTATLRAAAFQPGFYSTNIDTHTYLFANDVLAQDGSGLGGVNWGHAGPDWEMDQDIINHPDVESRAVVGDLLTLPTVSLVMDFDQMFGANGIYIRGQGVERATSVELVNPDGSAGFQADASVQIVGGSSTSRWKSDKLSLRLKFGGDFGPGDLEFPVFGPEAATSFDTLVLDAHLNNVWHYGGGSEPTNQRNRAQYLRDQYAADLQRAVGGYGPHDEHIQLYINGIYWGMHRLHERPDDNFAADYLGGDNDDYDVIKHSPSNVVQGSNANYLQLLAAADKDLSNPANYQAVLDQLDVDDFIGYMLVNFYGGNLDWAHHNWYASYNRVDPGGRWRFHSWDAEKVLTNLNDNVTGKDNSGGPTHLHQRLATSAEYRLRFADHVQQRFFNDGIMTPAKAAELYQTRLNQIDRAIAAESARWGDNQREPAYTRAVEWIGERDRLLNTYFPQRTAVVLSQLRNRGLFPSTSMTAPVMKIDGVAQHGGRIVSGDLLSFTAPAGTIYFTTDGTDPRQPGGSPAATAQAFTTAVPLSETTRVRARLRTAGGSWSALEEAKFYVTDVAGPENLAITEINYRPYGPTPEELDVDATFDRGDFEFIELANVGAETIDLTDTAFTVGIEFDFAASAIKTLDPGARVVVVNNEAAFAARYGTDRPLAGQFSGSLNDGGELLRLRLKGWDGTVIREFAYNDTGPWPGRADGKGATLELIDPVSDPHDGEAWRSSTEYGGSPGEVGSGPVYDVIVNEVLARSDGTGEDWIELVNASPAPVDVSGWYLSDDSGNLEKAVLPDGTVIQAGHYLVVTQAQLGFALDGQQGDDVWLMAADPVSGQLQRFADHWDFDATSTGVALGRWVSGDPEGTIFPMTSATPGEANTGPVQGPVILSEVHYHPALSQDDFEFIELYNTSPTAVDLGGWRLRGGVDFDFAAPTTLNPGAALVVVGFDPTDDAQVAAFRSVYDVPNGATLVGPSAGQLRDSGERVKLMRPTNPGAPETGFELVDQIAYDNQTPWPTAADGMGQSLTRTAADAFAGFAASWSAEPPTPGEAAFALLGDLNRDGQVNGLDVDPFVDLLIHGGYQAEADMNGDSLLNGLDVEPFVQAVIGAATTARATAAIDPPTATQANGDRQAPGNVAPTRRAAVSDKRTAVSQRHIVGLTAHVHLRGGVRPSANEGR